MGSGCSTMSKDVPPPALRPSSKCGTLHNVLDPSLPPQVIFVLNVHDDGDPPQVPDTSTTSGDSKDNSLNESFGMSNSDNGDHIIRQQQTNTTFTSRNCSTNVTKRTRRGQRKTKKASSDVTTMGGLIRVFQVGESNDGDLETKVNSIERLANGEV
eukprot:PhF_6_TR37721/c1_g1_i1/m.56157